MQSTPTDTPKMKKAPKGQPLMKQAMQTQEGAVRQQAAASSHNVFRPDIYRVSEGYLS